MHDARSIPACHIAFTVDDAKRKAWAQEAKDLLASAKEEVATAVATAKEERKTVKMKEENARLREEVARPRAAAETAAADHGVSGLIRHSAL